MWYHGFISAHHLIMISVYWRPMWGILRGLLLGFLFLIGGSSLNVPVPVSFVVFVLYCQLGTPWLRKTNYRQTKRREHFTNRQPPTRITPRTPRSSTIMPMRWTARIIPTCIASIRTIRSCMRKPKAQNVKFSTIEKAEEDVLPGRYRKRLLHDMDSPVPDRRHYHCNRFYF